MGKMEQFYTQEKASEGVKVPLFAPDGRKTEESITIRSVFCDEFRLAETQQNRRMVKDLAVLTSDEERAKLHINYKTELVAALVKDWSWSDEQPATRENVIAFLKRAPQIEQQIDRLASQSELFFALPSTDSTNSQKASLT